MPIVTRPDAAETAAVIRAETEAEISNHLNGVKLLHENLVKDWDKAEDRPTFKQELTDEGGKIVGYVIMEGEPAEQARTGITVWQLLERGTRVRYMQLSEDWASKTFPGRISSGSGSGQKLGIDTDNAHPGIRARNFAENIANAADVSADAAVRVGADKGFDKGFAR